MLRNRSCQILATAAFLALWANPLQAHEEGVLSVAASSVAAGSSLAVSGTRFSSATTYTLILKGALDQHTLGTIESDAEGAFATQLDVAAAVKPGVYRLVAVAPDGDDVAQADLTVTAAVAPASAQQKNTAQRQAATPTASAEELAIDRRWTGVEWFVIGVLLGGALATGAALYSRPRASGPA